MAVRKDTSKGKWLAEFYKDGRRIRKWFLTKGEALRFYNLNKFIADDSENFDLLVSKPKSSPPLSHFVNEWFDLHGQTLSDGLQIKNTVRKFGRSSS